MNSKYTILFLLTFLYLFQTCSASTDKLENPTSKDSIPPDYDHIMITPHQEMPYLLDCSEHGKFKEQKKCTDDKIIDVIYRNLQYPEAAIKNKTEGTVFIRFKVKKDSTVSDFEIIRDIGDGCGEEALRLVRLIPNKWVPATFMGKAIEITYNIPVKFRLEDATSISRFDPNAPSRISDADTIPPKQAVKITCFPEAPTPPPPPKPLEWDENIPRILETMPRFPGCENLKIEEEKKACSDEKIKEFIRKNIRYPKRGHCIEGTVIVRFVIEKDGSLSNHEILRDIGGGTGEEALKVIRKMPKWIPGKTNGKPMRVYYTLPVKFQL